MIFSSVNRFFFILVLLLAENFQSYLAGFTGGTSGALAVYQYVVSFYDPELNFLTQVFRPQYTIFSGHPGGFYLTVGKLLESSDVFQDDFAIKNQESDGGHHNAIKVMSNPASFGIIQEVSLADDDMIRDRINFITPLYLERLHILYSRRAFESLTRDETVNGRSCRSVQHPIRLDLPSEKPAMASKCAEVFFSKGSARTGPVGSSTYRYSSYLLTTLQFWTQHRAISLKTAYEDLAHWASQESKMEKPSDKVPILFTIAGAPLGDVTDLLDNSDTFLMSVAPAVINELNNKFRLKLRLADFAGKYPSGRVEDKKTEEVTTPGSFALLISSKDVPSSVVLKVLQILNMSKDQPDLIESPLSEFNFFGEYSQYRSLEVVRMLRNALLFAVSVSSLSLIGFFVINSSISSWKLAGYWRQLTAISERYFPVSPALDAENHDPPRPLLPRRNHYYIFQLLSGIAELKRLSSRVRDDYDTGGVSQGHNTYLNGGIEAVFNDFRCALDRHLLAAVRQGESLTAEDCWSYYTAGFLTIDTLERLLSALQPGSSDIRPTLPG